MASRRPSVSPEFVMKLGGGAAASESLRVSGWRRRPWSRRRLGWCTAGSAASAGGNTARWTSGGTGPGQPGPGHQKITATDAVQQKSLNIQAAKRQTGDS